jgi:serine/threonine protein kinase
MESKFTFPQNCYLSFGTIMNSAGRNFKNIDILRPLDNVITIDKVDYCFTYLQGATPGNKGGHSIILNLYELQTIDEDNVDYKDPDLVLKISKYKTRRTPDKKENRFRNEIKCLLKAKSVSENIMQIFHHGECKIQDERGNLNTHIFYTMEYAPFDLKTYIEQNHNVLTLENKVDLCLSLCNGLSELWDMDICHRDIKPDNIFFTYDNTWKIGDLGLASEKNASLDDIAEFVGPRGWLSPEAMNKYLCEDKGFSFKYNNTINHQSDLFQLGKVFWYIFQYNCPIGCIKESDFMIKNSSVYRTLRTMLSHSKKRRAANIRDVISEFKRVEDKLLKQKAA